MGEATYSSRDYQHFEEKKQTEQNRNNVFPSASKTAM
jgi:hypothetical protein